MDSNKIKIQALVNASALKSWAYYTVPHLITQWNFANDDWCCPSASNDMVVGGKYQARMEAKDGSFGFDFEGIYDDIKDGESFSYHLEDGRQVEVSFEPIENQTQVTVVFDPESSNPRELQEQGWQAILNNYKKFTETN